MQLISSQDDEPAILPLVAAVSLVLTIAAALAASSAPGGTSSLRAYLDHEVGRGAALVAGHAARATGAAKAPAPVTSAGRVKAEETLTLEDLPKLEELRPPARPEETAYDAPESVLVLSAPVPPDRWHAAVPLAAAPQPVEEPLEAEPLPMTIGAGVGLMPSKLRQPHRNARPKLSSSLRPAGPPLEALGHSRLHATR